MDYLKAQPEIIGIFPTPIYIENINRELTAKEKNFFLKIKEKDFPNTGNTTSIDNYILENKELTNLKKDLLQSLNNYYEKIICPRHEIKPYITQSWLNWTKKQQFHHQHNHPNSIISGVFYVDIDEKVDTIDFFKTDYINIKIEPDLKKTNMLNSNNVKLNLKKGMIILFPSHLSHAVSQKQDDNLRTSLAFNTFANGIFGENRELTELKL